MTHKANDRNLRRGEMISSGQGLHVAQKCDTSGDWYDCGPFRFSREAALADVLKARGRRRSSVEVINDD